MAATDPEVDAVLRAASPLHPPPTFTNKLRLDLGLDLGPITKRVLANDYNKIIRRNGSKNLVTLDEAGACDTVGDVRRLVAAHV